MCTLSVPSSKIIYSQYQQTFRGPADLVPEVQEKKWQYMPIHFLHVQMWPLIPATN